MKYALRHLWRNKFATAINVSGLAVALSAAFLMLQYLDFELSYDTYLPEHGNVYRIVTKNSSINTSETYYGVSDLISEIFPEVEASTRFYRWPANTGVVIEHQGKLYHEKNYMFVDKGFFHVFPTLLISGPLTAVDEPNTVVISERLAIKLFGTTDVIGKTIFNPEEENRPETITGLMRNTPPNSQFDIDIVRPQQWIPEGEWIWKSTTWTYVRLSEQTNTGEFTVKLNKAVSSKLTTPATLSLQPLASIHLQSNLESEIKAPGSMLNVYVVGGALALILLIAWINYINLETARFIVRLKEVSIRRIIGAGKKDLLTRFLTEIGLVMAISIILAAAIAMMVFPAFGYITGLPLTGFSFSVPGLWITTGIAILVATSIAGVYPLFSLNNFKAHDLKKKPLARNALLTFQFVSSLTLMALVVMASLQLDFMRSANRNFDTRGIVTVYNPANYTWKENSTRKENNEAFKNRISQIPSVVQFTTSSAIPGEAIGFTYTDLAKRSMSDPDRQIHYKVMYVDYDFISLFGLELVAGRNYSPENSEEWNIVVTESTVRELGFSSPTDAINQKIYFNEPDDWHLWTIIGVVKDYRHQSIKTPVNPTILRLNKKTGQLVYYSFKVSDAGAVPAIGKAWKEIWPGKPFDYYFMDQHYDQQYKSEIYFSRVFMLFSCVAVFIACLGVMGMSLFEANARIKEIGIRKVLGAEVRNIIYLLTKGSLRVLIISLFVATPIVYLFSERWLTTYPEHIDLSIWFMAGPFVLLLSLVLLTSISQILTTAVRNPVDALKHE